MAKRIAAYLMIVILLTTFAITFVGCKPQKGIKVPEVEPDVYVYDQENSINDEFEVEINTMLKELEEKTQAEFAVVSVPSLNDYTIEQYAYELFNTLGVGKANSDNGVLLLFSKADERVRIEVGRGLEGCLNDAKCGRILDDYFVPYREQGDYSKATRNTVIAVIEVVAEEYQVELENMGEAELDSEKEEAPIWAYVILFIVVFIVAFLKASVDDDDSIGGYHGGFSSGRSYRSGGFGGGRSGGGGASR